MLRNDLSNNSVQNVLKESGCEGGACAPAEVQPSSEGLPFLDLGGGQWWAAQGCAVCLVLSWLTQAEGRAYNHERKVCTESRGAMNFPGLAQPGQHCWLLIQQPFYPPFLADRTLIYSTAFQ